MSNDVGIPWGDTLLAYHAYASHLPMRLDHVVPSYCDSGPWKITHGRRGQAEKGQLPKDMSGPDLCKYNAMDVKLTAKAWDRMQVDLEPERKVYEHDMQLADLCQEMTVNGIGVDRVRMRELDVALSRRAAGLVGQMRHIAGRKNFEPTKLDDVRRVLFKTLRAQWNMPTATGLPSTSDAALEALQGSPTRAGRFATALLKWRVVAKIRSTYVNAIELNPQTLRAHFNWKPFGTVSGRLSGRLQSCPRWGGKIGPDGKPIMGSALPEDSVRELYVPGPGRTFVYFDVSQIEMRLAAYLSGDPNFIEACKGDIHANNAKKVFPKQAAMGWLDGDAKKDPTRGKPLRDIAKNFGFAIGYLAEVETLFITLRRKGFAVSFNAVSVILGNLRNAYRHYFRWVDANIARVRRDGFMRTAILGRIRWLGWYPKPTEVANFPIQSCAADILNRRSLDLRPIARGLDARLVLQVHDACGYDCPIEAAPALEKAIKEQWAEPIHLLGGAMTLPIDMKRGMSWAELG